jgi:threonine dehydrogenase-like Zn-dependent dehydrogenase
VIHEVSLIGSRCGPFAPAIEALAKGQVQVAPLLAAVLPLSEAARGIREASLPGALKIALDPSL